MAGNHQVMPVGCICLCFYACHLCAVSTPFLRFSHVSEAPSQIFPVSAACCFCRKSAIAPQGPPGWCLLPFCTVAAMFSTRKSNAANFGLKHAHFKPPQTGVASMFVFNTSRREPRSSSLVTLFYITIELVGACEN